MPRTKYAMIVQQCLRNLDILSDYITLSADVDADWELYQVDSARTALLKLIEEPAEDDDSRPEDAD